MNYDDQLQLWNFIVSESKIQLSNNFDLELKIWLILMNEIQRYLH